MHVFWLMCWITDVLKPLILYSMKTNKQTKNIRKCRQLNWKHSYQRASTSALWKENRLRKQAFIYTFILLIKFYRKRELEGRKHKTRDSVMRTVLKYYVWLVFMHCTVVGILAGTELFYYKVFLSGICLVLLLFAESTASLPWTKLRIFGCFSFLLTEVFIASNQLDTLLLL